MWKAKAYNIQTFITYLLRPRETVCFVDEGPRTKHTAFPRSQ